MLLSTHLLNSTMCQSLFWIQRHLSSFGKFLYSCQKGWPRSRQSRWSPVWHKRYTECIDLGRRLGEETIPNGFLYHFSCVFCDVEVREEKVMIVSECYNNTWTFMRKVAEGGEERRRGEIDRDVCLYVCVYPLYPLSIPFPPPLLTY